MYELWDEDSPDLASGEAILLACEAAAEREWQLLAGRYEAGQKAEFIRLRTNYHYSEYMA